LSIIVLPHALDAPVSALPKVKPADIKRLAKLGIETIRELLLTLPFDWETYGAPVAVASL
jgi:RecG-like helicase